MKWLIEEFVSDIYQFTIFYQRWLRLSSERPLRRLAARGRMPQDDGEATPLQHLQA